MYQHCKQQRSCLKRLILTVVNIHEILAPLGSLCAHVQPPVHEQHTFHHGYV